MHYQLLDSRSRETLDEIDRRAKKVFPKPEFDVEWNINESTPLQPGGRYGYPLRVMKAGRVVAYVLIQTRDFDARNYQLIDQQLTSEKRRLTKAQ